MSKLSDKLYKELVAPLYSRRTHYYLTEYYKEYDDYIVIFDNYFHIGNRSCVIRKSDLKHFYYTINGNLTKTPKYFRNNAINIKLFDNFDNYKVYKYGKKYLGFIKYINNIDIWKKVNFRILDKTTTDFKLGNEKIFYRLERYINRFGVNVINGLDDKSLDVIKNSYEISYYSEIYVPNIKDTLKALPYSGNTYKDYLRFRNYLNLNKNKRYPTYPKIEKLQGLHDELMLLYNRQKEIEEREKLSETNSKYLYNSYSICKKLEYTFGDYIIKAPEHIVELNTEGAALHHCVASYKESVSNGLEYILFLRKKDDPNTPYLTVNIDKDGNCRQIHGKYNNNIEDFPDSKQITEFLIKWSDKNKKFLNKETILNNCNQIHRHL